MRKYSDKEIADFRTWVKSRREELGLTQLELAEKTGLGRGTVGGIESGANVVGKKARSALVKVLGGGSSVFQNGRQNHNEINHYHAAAGGTHVLVAAEFSSLAAKLISSPDFEERVAAIEMALKCSRTKAIEVLLKEAIDE